MERNTLKLALNHLKLLMKSGDNFLPEVSLVFNKNAITGLAFLLRWHDQGRIQARPGYLALAEVVFQSRNWERDENRKMSVRIHQGHLDYFANTFAEHLDNVLLVEEGQGHALSFMIKPGKVRDSKIAELIKHIQGDQELSETLSNWSLVLETKFNPDPTLPTLQFNVKEKESDRPIFKLELDGLSGLVIVDGELLRERYQKPATAIRLLRSGTLATIDSITN